jgi:hypothetical protein
MTNPTSALSLSALDEAPDAPLDELRRRQYAWRSTQRPDTLWPGLDRAVLQSAADAIGRAVTQVLRGERGQLAFDSGAHDTERGTRAVGVAALITGVGPLLGAWSLHGALNATERLARVLARHAAHGRAREARLREAVLPVLARMEHDGLEPGVIKGFHTAHAYFPEPGARPFSDVDVVVAPGAIGDAERVLGEAGFQPEPRTGGIGYKREWIPPEGRGDVWSYELWHARSRWKLDLHDGLNFDTVVRNVRAPQTARLTDVLHLEGVSLRVADPNELIAVLAAHASTELYSQRLLRCVELVLVVRRASALGRVDWTAVESSLAERESLRFAYPMLALTERLAPGTVDEDFLTRLRTATTPRARAVADGLSPTAPILDSGFSLRERLMWALGAAATLRWLWSMVAPLDGVSRRDQLRTYRHRALRVLRLGRALGIRSDRDGGG